MGLRVSEDTEVSGLDVAEHGEEGYHDSVGGTMEGGAHAHSASVLSTVDQALKSARKGEQAV